MKLESSGKNPQNCPVETDYFFLAGWLAASCLWAVMKTKFDS